MATTKLFCGICELRKLSRDPVIWCFECEEAFCTDCSEHHVLSKSSRQHNTVPIERYKTLPHFILNIKQFCNKHNERYHTFCKTHDCPCCRKCVVDHHKECTDIVILEDVICREKISTRTQEVLTQLIDISDNITKIKTNRDNSIQSLKIQREMIQKEISETRNNINDHLDQLQEKLLKELNDAEVEANIEIRKVKTALEKKETEINEFREGLDIIRKNASDLQAFLVINKIESVASENEKYLQSLVESGRINQTSLSGRIGDGMRSLLGNLQTFGEIIVETKPSDITIEIRKLKQAQTLVPHKSPKSFEKLQLKLKGKVQYETYSVKGCCILPDGSMLFSSSSVKCLFLLNKDGSIGFEMDLSPGIPFGLTLLDNSTIAVAVDKSVRIINIEKQSVQRTILGVGGFVYGITYKDGKLLCCVCQKGILSINLEDDMITYIVSCPLSSLSYVTTYQNSIYYTDYKKHTVTCCDMSGRTQWQFSDAVLLKSPCGITVDRNGFIFVVGSGTCNVVVISIDSEKEQYRELLCKKDRLIDPSVIHCDKMTNRLLIPNWSENASLYEVQ